MDAGKSTNGRTDPEGERGEPIWRGEGWRETTEAPLEEKLRAIIADIAAMFETIRLRREREAEEHERRWRLEEESRLAEMERKREKIRYRRLIGNCEDWPELMISALSSRVWRRALWRRLTQERSRRGTMGPRSC